MLSTRNEHRRRYPRTDSVDDKSDGPDDSADYSVDFAPCTSNDTVEPLPSPDAKPKEEFDGAAYSSKRDMTPLQERVNALTILPSAVFCLYYIFACKWMDGSAMRSVAPISSDTDSQDTGMGCFPLAMFPQFYSYPPLPVLALAFGIILHCPFSFLYHWKYAILMPPGIARIGHWSRRLDHSGIHICSAFWSYATSGSVAYFLLNLLYNGDCTYRQFEQKVQPRRNQIRILVSMLAYTAPLLCRGESDVFCRVWSIFIIAVWLFAAYPLGGWSHSAFHIVLVFVPPILLASACRLPVSISQINNAQLCAASFERNI